MKIYVLQGLPGSGKTTWAKNFIEKNTNYVRVNRDDLRSMRFPYWKPKQENLITDWEDDCIFSALRHGYNVILDATNLNQKRTENRMKKFLDWHNDGTHPEKLKVEYKFFDTSLEQCIANDLKRENSVGEKVIRGMYEKYLKPKPAVYNEDKTLPNCIICDIDGTLARNTGRSPFDWHKVDEDEVIEPVAATINKLSIHSHIIIFTGRDGGCLDITKDWLRNNNITYNEIYSRPEGDNRKDWVIKQELFENHVRGRYYCDFVIDDRKQVKRMWVENLGIFVFDVNQTDKEF